MIMERIDGPTLKEVLRRGGAMKPRRVAGILQQIASALSNVHDLGLVYGSLHSSSLFLLEKDDLLKLSVIDLSNEVMLSERMRGSIVTSYEMLNYMTPEVYIGGLVSQKSDQYYLGLLALEMLNGKPPVEISCIADLNKKETFFKEPRRYFGDRQTLEPGLARIIARSLSENPDARWPNMRSVAHMLQAVCDLAPADPFEDLIKTSYNKYCAGRTEFYRAFYERFFVKSPELREYFRQIDLDGQYGMLDDAVALLTNFHPEPWREPTALSRTKRIHAGLGLEKKHYEEFTSAFIETVRAIGEEDKDTLNAWACLFERGTDYLISAEV